MFIRVKLRALDYVDHDYIGVKLRALDHVNNAYILYISINHYTYDLFIGQSCLMVAFNYLFYFIDMHFHYFAQLKHNESKPLR